MTGNHHDAAALIIGLTIQGLAVARALARSGVKVYVVERRRGGPEARSRYLRMFQHQGVNPEVLADTLLHLRGRMPERDVVLFPCSDKTVRAIAADWERLSGAYRLSWSDCTELTASFTLKTSAYRHAAEHGVDYPRAKVIGSLEDCGKLDGMRFPLIVKPDQPPGSFKTRMVASADQLVHLISEHGGSLPFVAQEWVDGGADRLQFCTLFLDKGRVLASVTGRKRRSYQGGPGRGTVMELHEDAEVREKSLQFLTGLPLCGQVSVEFKRDSSNRLWLIEPNVGRTEYCVDLTIQGGLNLPYLEYCYTLGYDYGQVLQTPVDLDVIWYDTEIEPHCFVLDCMRQRTIKPYGKRPIFPYHGHHDAGPLLYAYAHLLVRVIVKGIRWVLK